MCVTDSYNIQNKNIVQKINARNFSNRHILVYKEQTREGGRENLNEGREMTNQWKLTYNDSYYDMAHNVLTQF